MPKKAFLIILDGWGHGKEPHASAISQAHTPYMDNLYESYPHAELVTYGTEVGLPEGQMGNSEVGHLNIGAGRIVYQDFSRINNAIEDGSFAENKSLKSVLQKAKTENKKVHLMGLLSDGGVHSHIKHLKALCDITVKEGLEKVFIHAFLDGRDTSPNGGQGYLKDLMAHINNTPVKLSTIIGRYYAMDRDKRWERTQKAYDLMVNAKSDKRTSDPIKTVEEYYEKDTTDEFMKSISINNQIPVAAQSIENGDIVICFNFRTDRPRQITGVLTQNDKPEFGMHKLDLTYAMMTNYNESFEGLEILFDKDNLQKTIGEVVSENGLSQLRIAETEKYPHVTFFLNGGREAAFSKEERIVIDSPKVATYDLKPEMSAYEVTNAVYNHIKEKNPDLIILNYANADMVGHTGSMPAAVKAVECLDACLESLVPFALKENYNIVIIADHGNSDYMINPDGSAHTAHTLNPVPIIILSSQNDISAVKNGKLADIAPTILKLMALEAPKEMNGTSLI